ncbi:MAG: hypothetical protein ISS35_08875 [Kiritimatiellae bacterium]|nr:hypothetical protein [Kiritimatiellia bacterium]
MAKDRAVENTLLGKREFGLRRWTEHFTPAKREPTSPSWLDIYDDIAAQSAENTTGEQS